MATLRASIRAIEYHLPDSVLSSEMLAAEFPEWDVLKLSERIGVHERHIAAPQECSSDLAVEAARKLFGSGVCSPSSVDYVLLCTQSPDYFVPTTACLVQHRLGIPQTAGAIDFNLGASGYVYGLGLAQGLIETGQAATVLLLAAETYSKFVNPRDKNTRLVFGDGAAATLISGVNSDEPFMGPYVYGSDGGGAPYLMVPAGGMRQPRTAETGRESQDENGNFRSADNLFMDGAEVFSFSASVVPRCVNAVLERAAKTLEGIDLFVFHQANRYMLEQVRKRLKIPPEKFYIAMGHCGNTVSVSIPIALKDACEEGRLKDGDTVMLVGYGMGYSWGGTLIRWRESASS